MRVAAGAIAQKILGEKIKIRGALIQMGKEKINLKNWNWNEVNKNSFFCPDKKMVKKWEKYLLKIRKEGSSVGAVIQVSATGVPAGLGEPVFKKIDALIAQAMMSIPAVKGVELGAGFKSAELRGEENADEMIYKNNKIQFKSNNAGGSLGGISSGQDIVTKFVVKPTSSILTKKKTIDLKNKNTSIITRGRHDPCVGIRAVPVGEAMLAIVLADLYLLKKNNQI
jgi:chorismate synthase